MNDTLANARDKGIGILFWIFSPIGETIVGIVALAALGTLAGKSGMEIWDNVLYMAAGCGIGVIANEARNGDPLRYLLLPTRVWQAICLAIATAALAILGTKGDSTWYGIAGVTGVITMTSLANLRNVLLLRRRIRLYGYGLAAMDEVITWRENNPGWRDDMDTQILARIDARRASQDEITAKYGDHLHDMHGTTGIVMPPDRKRMPGHDRVLVTMRAMIAYLKEARYKNESDDILEIIEEHAGELSLAIVIGNRISADMVLTRMIDDMQLQKKSLAGKAFLPEHQRKRYLELLEKALLSMRDELDKGKVEA